MNGTLRTLWHEPPRLVLRIAAFLLSLSIALVGVVLGVLEATCCFAFACTTRLENYLDRCKEKEDRTAQ